jgi:hypothetical protein
MVGLQFGIVKSQFTILSIFFPITLNKDFLIKTNDVNVQFIKDCSFQGRHWHHHL